MQSENRDIILLVTNQGNLAEVTHNSLSSLGYSVRTAKSYDFKSVTPNVALVFLDYELNEIDAQNDICAKWFELSASLQKEVIFFTDDPKLLNKKISLPVVCTQNLPFLDDYLQLKIAKNSESFSRDDLFKSLLQKDLEKEQYKSDLHSLQASFRDFPEHFNGKIAHVTKFGHVLSYSSGLKQIFGKDIEPTRSFFFRCLNAEDFKEVKETFVSFNERKSKFATHWLRLDSQENGAHYVKAYFTNFLDVPHYGFISVSFEDASNNDDLRKLIQQKLWFSEVIETYSFGLVGGNSLAINSNIEKILYLLPKLMDVRRLVVLVKNPAGDQFRVVQEWCKDGAICSGINERSFDGMKIEMVINKLDSLDFEEICVSQNPQFLVQPEFLSFLNMMHLNTFVNIPLDNGSRIMGYILLDLEYGRNENPYSADQLSGKLIAEALEFGKNEDTDKSNAYAYDFLNFLPVPISIKDKQHRWILANDAMLEFLGKKREQVLGKDDYELFDENQADIFWETDDLVLSEKINFQNEEYINTQTGEPKIVVTNKSLFRTIDKQEVIVSTLKDVTKLKQIEKDLRERSEKLRKNERKLKTLNSTKDRFFSIIAHDLKNPFNTLVGFSSILVEDLDQFDKGEIQEFVKIIYDAAQHGYKLLENLLDWARTQTGKFHFEPSTINIQYLIDECLSLLNASAEKKNVKLSSLVNIPVYAFADSNMIEMVIRNLLSNAIKFTHFGGAVYIDAVEKSNHIEVSVKDNGVGIREEDIDKLFRIDVEFSSTGTDAETGTGLGLILCKEFIEKNNGAISVESQYGVGSQFTFSLPKAREIAEIHGF